MQRFLNSKKDQIDDDDDDVELYLPNVRTETDSKSLLIDKLNDGISKVEEDLNISIAPDSENKNLDLYDRILRIGTNVKSLHQRVSNLISDILNQTKQNTQFTTEILHKIKEDLQDAINIPTEDVETQEAFQKIHRMAFCYVEEPEKLQKVLQQSVNIHQKDESKIKFLQGRIMDLEQQVNFFIENQENNEQIDSELRLKEIDDLKQENSSLRKKYKELALKYKKVTAQNSIDDMKREIDLSKQKIECQSKEITEMKSKAVKTEADLAKFKKAYVALKKRYDAILVSIKEKEQNSSQIVNGDASNSKETK